MSQIIQLTDTKNFLRVDFTDDDSLIQILIDAAEQYLTIATGKSFDSTNPVAQHVCYMLVASAYMNRENGQQLAVKANSVVTGLIYQLSATTTVTTSLPSAPVGLTVIAVSGYNRLRWLPNISPDTGGYNVYRNGVKVNQDPVREGEGMYQVPFFYGDWPILDEEIAQQNAVPPGIVQLIDGNVTSGQLYSYQVSAVDNLGNESALSTAVQVTAV
ncbi:head-tail connector protein [Alicyclobacillus sp. ALC3]|uniref:head-tail connector protein n=1 Tax=Alicyclobacillus sp. ALC3 TaxID=2796143 RepID=UPI002379D112|nr:head-tail connector protein [Alicyclobacillus sp. ALC3]WDL98129.1 phage head-tail connector protein [Alicyclobacillus sp. ALC3]